MSLIDTEARNNVETREAEGSGHHRMKILAIHKLPRLIVGFGTIVNSATGVKLKPHRNRTMENLLFAAHKVQLRQFSNGDFVIGSHALELDIAVGNDEEAVAVPMFRDIANGVRLGKDGFVKAFGERLPEQERAQVVDLAASKPAISQVRFSVEREQHSTLLLNNGRAIGIGSDLHTLVIDGVQGKIKVRAGRHFAAEVEGVRHTPQGENLRPVQSIIAAIDRPIVSETEHVAAQRAVTN